MSGHHGMTVDAPSLPLVGREQIAKSGIALQLRRADDERHMGSSEKRAADLDRSTDAADFRAGVEGRTDLVVTKGRLEILQPGQRGREAFVHPGQRLAAA